MDSSRRCCMSSQTRRVVFVSPSFSPIAKVFAPAHMVVHKGWWVGGCAEAELSFSLVGFSPQVFPREAQAAAVLCWAL